MKSLNNKRLRKAYLIAELLTQQVQLTAAEKMYMLTLARHEKALGADHMLTLLTVNNLGNLYANQGKLDEAEKMYQRALAGYEQALGPDHTSTLDAVNNFGNLYTHQGKLDEAEKMYQRALTGSAGIQIDHVARRERGMTGCVAGSGSSPGVEGPCIGLGYQPRPSVPIVIEPGPKIFPRKIWRLTGQPIPSASRGLARSTR
ncbi:hypothetical protein PV05_09917 [Exophiala xenobiotica]|uniref:Uncharacterized protein n=1 Tax=Exophiala xenobiotica TaxID=348802 RepID=A0A0D2E928_9EURO|nr:uncharacterized protein PV05_09917 [Exophiala xenobiotica]KIW51170.1 hypothetical protein PV05_09917 [Exophiala xenobiotica]